VRDTLDEQQAYRLNEAVLHCGVAFLERYQALKQQKQQMDFSDLEWQLCRLLQQSEHAETMQYKLDSRYRHVLLDEFQDTNPLQWQIMRAWFDAAVAVESQPTVFVVGDPSSPSTASAAPMRGCSAWRANIFRKTSPLRRWATASRAVTRSRWSMR